MRKKRKKKSHVLAALLLSAAFLTMLSVSGLYIYRYYVDDKKSAFAQGGDIFVYPDETADKLLSDIDEILQPYDTNSVRRVLEMELVGRSLCPGKYSFGTSQSARYLARAITRGWQTPVNVVIAGSIRFKSELARRFSSYLMYDAAAFTEAFNDSLLLDAYGTTPSRFFELVIPDTYEMYWTATPKEVVARMRREYDNFWNEERLACADSLGLTPLEVSVLASIVCEETARKSDMPLIASVYLNRLKKGMKLQACPTVCYIYNYELRRVLYRHLRTKSPYNTYLNEGLPPTPICVPSKECLEAVLHPANTNYLFFSADPSLNGATRFASTAREHSRNASEYSKALDIQSKNKDDGKDI